MSSSLGAHWIIAFDIEHNRWLVVKINTKVTLKESKTNGLVAGSR